MNVPRPYSITVYNRANDEIVSRYIANDPPRSGDLISVYPEHTKDGDPFHLWGLWRVDAVLWRVSGRSSRNGLDIRRETNGRISEAVCWELEITVWPEQGPHWTETPKWQNPLLSVDCQDDNDD